MSLDIWPSKAIVFASSHYRNLRGEGWQYGEEREVRVEEEMCKSMSIQQYTVINLGVLVGSGYLSSFGILVGDVYRTLCRESSIPAKSHATKSTAEHK